MSTRQKNDEMGLVTYDESLWARLQRFLRLVKIRQINVKGSPDECVAWMIFLSQNPPPGIEVLIETQTIKHPYQFGVQVTQTFRGIGLGLVVGDIIAHPTNQNQSIVKLRLYQNITSIIMMVILIAFITIAGITLFRDFSFTLGHGDLCMQCIGIGFIGMAIVTAVVFFRRRYKGIDLITSHLLNLNVRTKAAVDTTMIPPETKI